MSYAGAIAGGTLGFIGADLPGAILGAKIGYNLGKSQKNLPMKRKAGGVRKRSSRTARKVYPKGPLRRVFKKRVARKRTARRKNVYPSRGPAFVGNDMTLVKFHMPGSGKRLKAPFAGRIRYSDTYSAVIDGDIGTQRVFVGRYAHHRNQLVVTSTDAASENDRSTSATNVFELNPNRVTTGNAELGAVSTAPQSETMYVSNHSCSMSLTNFEQLACHVEIYWLLCRREGNDEPDVTWANDNTNLSLTQPVYNQPNVRAGVPSPGYPTSSYYGQQPTSGFGFKSFWKVVMKKEFILPGGVTIRMEFNRDINKLLKRQLVSGVNMQRGLTFVPMFIFKPAPVAAKATADATYVCNTGSCRIGYMQYDTFNYHVLKDKTVPINRVYSGNEVLTFTGADQQMMEQDGDATTVKRVG